MTTTATQRLLDIMAALRHPDHGCPWDREQTFRSIVPYTLEEAYELAEAIERQEPEAIKDELGDLLFQVVFYTQLGQEQAWFDFDGLANQLAAKLERRHPHVFADAEGRTPAAVSGQWERIKEQERRAAASDGQPATLDGVAANLPALTRAQKLQQRAARIGFDWGESAPVLDKIEEELAEFRQQLEQGDGAERLAEELGDLLFACVNLARHAEVDPETALRGTNRKFESRFRYIESRLAAIGRKPEDSSLEDMDGLWEEAKLSEKPDRKSEE
mgnify:CR=1 FL=1